MVIRIDILPLHIDLVEIPRADLAEVWALLCPELQLVESLESWWFEGWGSDCSSLVARVRFAAVAPSL